MSMNDIEQIKKDKSAIVKKYAKSNNEMAFYQTLSVIIPYFSLFYLALLSTSISYWLTAALIALQILFLMRVFMMMHDCGHDSLFDNPKYNKIVGFIMGVLCGIPQYVWSRHHAYHHSTNGNWNKYRGPLSVLSTHEYGQLSDNRKKSYQKSRNILMAPFGGFMYFIFNPRFTWIKGSLDYAIYFISTRLKNNDLSLQEINQGFVTTYWTSWKEYRHMAGNNIVLLASVGVAGWYFGWLTFLPLYVIAISLSGALGIILFSIQHNFEDSYASADEGWDYYTAALEGTSYLTLPKILHWFTADIGYHHVHHLLSKIPNYKLVECHEEYAHLFTSVKRIKLSDAAEAFKFILWDIDERKMISIAQYEERYQQPVLEQA